MCQASGCFILLRVVGNRVAILSKPAIASHFSEPPRVNRGRCERPCSFCSLPYISIMHDAVVQGCSLLDTTGRSSKKQSGYCESGR